MEANRKLNKKQKQGVPLTDWMHQRFFFLEKKKERLCLRTLILSKKSMAL
jgi:hypothetical protein